MTAFDFNLLRGKYIRKKKSSNVKYIEEFLKKPVASIHYFYE